MEDSENKRKYIFTCRTPLTRGVGGKRLFVVKTREFDYDFSRTVDNVVSVFGTYTKSKSVIYDMSCYQGGAIPTPSIDRMVLLTKEQKEQLIALIEMAGGYDVSFTTNN